MFIQLENRLDKTPVSKDKEKLILGLKGLPIRSMSAKK